MKAIRKLSKLAVTGILMTAFALNFNACTKRSPFAPGENGDNKDENQSDGYAVSGSTTLTFKNGAYKGGTIQLDQGSMLTTPMNSLTPPPGTPAGANVTITMKLELANDEINLTFGPHGCQFDPPVQLRVDYSDLGVDLPTLFYIDENGNSIEQTPNHVNSQGKWLTLSFAHFSRYAVAWSN